jgi:WD40 repeat protein
MQLGDDGGKCSILSPRQILLHTFERPSGFRELGDNLGGRVWRAAFSADSRWLAAAGGKQVGLWDLQTAGAGRFAEQYAEGFPFFTQDGAELFVSGNGAADSLGSRWRISPAETDDGEPGLERLRLNLPAGLTGLCVHSNVVAVTGARGSQLITADQIVPGPDHWLPTAQGVNGISPDGKWMGVFAPFGSTLFVYALPDLKPVAKLSALDHIHNFAFSPAGDELAIASGSRVEFWSTASWAPTRTLTNFMNVIYSKDARSLWLWKDTLNSGLYDTQTARPLLLLPREMLPLAVSPDGLKLAVSIAARRVQVWDLAELRRHLRDLAMDWVEGPQ